MANLDVIKNFINHKEGKTPLRNINDDYERHNTFDYIELANSIAQ